MLSCCFFSTRSKPMNENEANELFANEIESNKWTFSIYLFVHLFQCGKTDLCVLQYVGIQLGPGALIYAVYAIMKCYSSAILVRLSFTRCPALPDSLCTHSFNQTSSPNTHTHSAPIHSVERE